MTLQPETGEVLDRLNRLEEAVDTVALEVERIGEGQRFVTKALADHPVQVSSEAPSRR